MDTNNIYEGTLKYKLIYIFAIYDREHEGYLKIGEHSFVCTGDGSAFA